MSYVKRTMWVGCFILVAAVVHGQTGPVGPITPKINGGVQPPVNSGGLTADMVVSYFQSKGGNPQLQKAQNGSVTITSNIAKDNWRFNVEVMFVPNGKYYHLLSNLGVNAGTMNQQRLLGLLKWHYEHPDFIAHFSYRPQDGMLCFEEVSFPAQNTNTQQFEKNLNVFLDDIKETYPLWSAQAAPAGRGAGRGVGALGAPESADDETILRR